jgi:6-phosphogluconolactonase (cycloisomerase 2 family)
MSMTRTTSQLTHSRRAFLKGTASLACALTVERATAAVAGSDGSGNIHAYVGSYTSAVDGGANGEGIYLFKMDSRTGELSGRRLAAKTRNPSWICIHPSKKYLYAINEITDFNGSSGSVSAFSIDRESGELTLLNSVSSEGAGPAHMSLDASGKFAFVANYLGGSIAVLPILAGGLLGSAVGTRRDTGSIGPKHASNAPGGSFAVSGHDLPHAHMIAPDPHNKFVLSTDLGQDRIYVYRFDSATGRMTPLKDAPFVSLPSGDGPRHFVFHPNGHWLYSLQEESSTITFFLYDAARGSLTAQKTISALPAGFAGTSFASEIQVSPDGKFIYSANRLHDSISVCSIAADGSLKLIDEVWTMGDYPRHFQFGPSGNFLYVCNQRSDSVTPFKVQRDTGRLTFTGRYTAVGTPAFITFLA